jgi:hypothetical protein
MAALIAERRINQFICQHQLQLHGAVHLPRETLIHLLVDIIKCRGSSHRSATDMVRIAFKQAQLYMVRSVLITDMVRSVLSVFV